MVGFAKHSQTSRRILLPHRWHSEYPGTYPGDRAPELEAELVEFMVDRGPKKRGSSRWWVDGRRWVGSLMERVGRSTLKTAQNIGLIN